MKLTASPLRFSMPRGVSEKILNLAEHDGRRTDGRYNEATLILALRPGVTREPIRPSSERAGDAMTDTPTPLAATPEEAWHSQPIEAVAKTLGTRLHDGLTPEEA